MTELQRIPDAEIIDPNQEAEQDLVEEYKNAQDRVSDALWERARISYLVAQKLRQEPNKEVRRAAIESFAKEVGVEISQIRNDAFAYLLRTRMEAISQPIPETLSPTYFVDAAQSRRKAITSGDEDAVRETGEILHKAEDEGWTTSQTRKEATGYQPQNVEVITKVACSDCGVIHNLSDLNTWTEKS